MKISDFCAGLITGVAAGIVVSVAAKNIERNVSAELVLKSVKDAFKEEGPIDGSWISMKTEPFSREAITTMVYKGGISRMKNGEQEHYEFAADAITGTVVEINKV